MKYPAINKCIRSEYDELTLLETPIGYSIMDFWKWSSSDLILNKTRGIFAEFIVATAVGFEGCPVQNDWEPYDLTAENGQIKIEVKSAAYIQSWEQEKLSDVLFAIRPPKNGTGRPADVYVFCLFKHQEKATADPLKLEQWEFYVLSTIKLNNYKRSETSITLKSLRTIAGDPVSYSELKNKILIESNYGI
jgi:hypothetical protein